MLFQQFKNIDTAFKYIRLFSLALLLANCCICGLVLYYTFQTVRATTGKVYVLAGEKLLEAAATERAEKLPFEIRDHVKMFHRYFYSLEPDDAVIKNNISQALYLADGTAKKAYDDLTESGYYQSVISANISQQVPPPDSITIVMGQVPYFRYHGTLKIIRATSVVTRSLVTEGYIRFSRPSDNNAHGLLIERWRLLDNKDINVHIR